MTLALAFAAIRRHPCSIMLTALVAILTASLIGTSVQIALAVWAAVALASFELWSALEPIALKRLGGFREPTSAERQRLEAALGRSPL